MFNRNIAMLVAFVIVAACVLGGLFFLKHRRKDKSRAAKTPSMALHLTDANFDAEIEKIKGVVLLDFWAEWCGPCRIIAPFVEEMAVEYKGRMQVAKVDVDKSPELAKRFEITGIPLLVILKDGKVVDKRLGALKKSELKEWVDGVLSQ